MKSTMNEIGDTGLFAVYKIQDSKITASCVMRQIIRGEKNFNNELFYRVDLKYMLVVIRLGYF